MRGIFNITAHDEANMDERISYLEYVLFDKLSSVKVDCQQLSQTDKNFLLISAAKRSELPIVRLLLHHKAVVDTQNADGLSALHYAVMNNNMEVTLALIQNYANVNILDKKRESPLHKVVSTHASRDMILLLFRSGANAWIKNYDSITAASFLFRTKFDDQFWLVVIGNDCEANMLVTVKSPILYVNKLFKAKDDKMSDFAQYIFGLLQAQDPSVLKALLLWHTALMKASEFHPSEETDLKSFADKVESVVNEIFNCDSMDKPINVQKLLQPDKAVSSKVNLLKYQINAFRENGLLDLCLHHECKFLFEKQQISAFVNDIFWFSASIELGKYERDLMRKGPAIVRDSMRHHSPVESVDLVFRLVRLNPLENELVRLSYGARSCPALRFISEAVSKMMMVVLVATVSIYEYGPTCGTAYTSPCHLGTISVSESIMVFFFITTVMYEVGELAELRWNVAEYFRDDWNYLDVSGLTLIVIWAAVRGTNLSEGRIFLALSAIPLSLGLLRYFAANRTMGLLVVITRAMLVDLVGFLAVYLLCVLGFGIFFQSLFYSSDSFHSVGNTALQMFEYTLNSFDFSVFNSTSSVINGLGQIVLAIYLLFTAILLVNLLIARMSNAYQRIDDKALQEWSFEKAKTVQKNILLNEKHPFCMLMPPFNLVTAVLHPIHFKYLSRGVSIAGTVSNVLLTIGSAPLRAACFFLDGLPSVRGVAYTALMEKHSSFCYRVVYTVTNLFVFFCFTVVMCLSAVVPLALDLYYKPLPKLDYWVEKVVHTIPAYLFLAVDNMRLVQGQSAAAEAAEVVASENDGEPHGVEMMSRNPMRSEELPPVAFPAANVDVIRYVEFTLVQGVLAPFRPSIHVLVISTFPPDQLSLYLVAYIAGRPWTACFPRL